MNEFTSEPDPESDDGSEQNKPNKKTDLVVRMHEKRAEFAELRAQFTQFRRGYNNRLNEFYQFTYEMNEEFLRSPEELLRFTKEEYFNCNQQKPNETNLSRHLLYFLADARADSDRDKFIRPAAVLEYFCHQGIPAHEVAQRLKDGGGFSRIYKKLPGKRAVGGDSSDDLDVLRQEPEPPDDTPALPGTVDTSSEAPCPSNSKGDDAALPAPVPIAGPEGETPGSDASTAASGDITGSAASAAGINLKSNAISGEPETSNRISRTRVDLKNTVSVIIPPFDKSTPLFKHFTVDTVINAKRGVIFFENKPPEADGWREVTAVDVTTWDDDALPWPKLIDPSDPRLHRQNAAVVRDEEIAHEGWSAEPASVTNQSAASAPLTHNADEGRNSIVEPAVLTPTSTTARPVAPEGSGGVGKVETREASRSAQAGAIASTKHPPPNKISAPKNSITTNAVGKTRTLVDFYPRAHVSAPAPIAKLPKR